MSSDKVLSAPPPTSKPTVQRGVSTVSQPRPAVRRGVSTVSGVSSKPPAYQRGVSTISSSAKSDGNTSGPKVQWQSSTQSNQPPTLRKQITSFFGHFSFIVIIGLYTAFGGFIFVLLEKPNEVEINHQLRLEAITLKKQSEERIWQYVINNLIDKSCNVTDMDAIESGVRSILIDEIDKQIEFIYKAADNGVDVQQESQNFGWNYASAMFFSATVITTIGYGNIAPVTAKGQIFCIIYALFGIPLTVIVIADMGKLFASFVVFINKKVKTKMKATGTIKEEKVAEVSRLFQSLKAVGAMFLLLLYIGSGAVLFILWEDWSLFKSFYFCFITMTTIGLGDVVPDHKIFMLLCTVYILIGLALTSTCIELARSEYEKSWQRMLEASMRLQTLSGVNLADTLKKLGDHMDVYGDIVDLNLMKDLKEAIKGVTGTGNGDSVDNDDYQDDPNKPPPVIMYETTV